MIEELPLGPEDLVIAVLHKVGSKVRIRDDHELAKIFNEAAEAEKGRFAPFRWNPYHLYSRLLSDTLLMLDQGGAIRRPNATLTFFEVAPQTEGSFGKSIYNEFDPDERKTIDELAARIRQAFQSPHVAS